MLSGGLISRVNSYAFSKEVLIDQFRKVSVNFLKKPLSIFFQKSQQKRN